MAFEEECDIMLYEISELQEHDAGYRKQGVTHDVIFSKIDNQTIKNNFGTIINRLLVDEFIEIILKTGERDSFKISRKGIVFLATDKYVNRKKRWDLDSNIKVLEYSLKKKTFWIAVGAAIISLLSLILSLIQLIKKK